MQRACEKAAEPGQSALSVLLSKRRHQPFCNVDFDQLPPLSTAEGRSFECSLQKSSGTSRDSHQRLYILLFEILYTYTPTVQKMYPFVRFAVHIRHRRLQKEHKHAQKQIIPRNARYLEAVQRRKQR